MTTILIQGTHGKEDPEKANLPFIIGNVATTGEQDVTIFLTSDAVWLATRGYADDLEFGGHPPVGQLAAAFVGNGGTIWACGACTGPRDINVDQLIDGVSIVTAATLTELLVDGVQTIGF